MIVPALVRLYDRLSDEVDDAGQPLVAPAGYSEQKISFKVVLNPDGSLHAIEPVFVEITREITKNTKKGPVTEVKVDRRLAQLFVPGQSKSPGSGINPCFLWDNTAYMLGYKADDKKPERTRQTFDEFRKKHADLKDEIDDKAFDAVCLFLESWRPDDAGTYPALVEATTGFGVFQIRGERGYIHERPRIREWWKSHLQAEASHAASNATLHASSLIDGRLQPIAEIHEPKIKGVFGAQSAGALLVSFNQSAFESYGKEQGANAPVGAEDAEKYCTALNYLTTDDKHRVRIAGDTYVFWAEKPAKRIESFMHWTFDDAGPLDEEARSVFIRARDGRPVSEVVGVDPATPFYVLGLSPNMARLSVRLWLVSTVGDVVDRLRRHHDALRMEPSPDEDDRPMTLRRLVGETVPPKTAFPIPIRSSRR